MKCPSCHQREVRIQRKPERFECRNPKCSGVKPRLNPKSLFPSLKGKK